MAGENPFAKYVPGGGGGIYSLPPSATEQRKEARAERGENRSDMTAGVSVADTAHDNATADRNNRLGNPQSLRKEFHSLPEVQNYSVAAQQLSQALDTGAGPQADLALTYAFAKAMDPNSVVRESEQGMVTGSQPVLQSTIEGIKKQFQMDGAGNYTPETRAQLRQQIIRSVASRRHLYEQARDNFSANARSNGIDPQEVIGQHVGEAYRAQARAYDSQRRAAGATMSNTGSGIGAMAGGLTRPPRRGAASKGGWAEAPRRDPVLDAALSKYGPR